MKSFSYKDPHVGDVVEVIDNGETFSRYEDFVMNFCPDEIDNFKNGSSPYNGSIGKIIFVYDEELKVKSFPICTGLKACIIKIQGRVFLMDSRGLKLIKDCQYVVKLL